MTEPSWGRVAADGTVFVRTADGERAVGSFQAGSAEQALAYYTRKFDALELEVDLFERRVQLPEVSPDEAAATLRRLRDALVEPAAVGDLDGLRARLDAVAPAVDERREQARTARDEARTHAREQRERIVTEAESLAESTQWKSTGERLRVLLDEWKAAPHVDRPTEQSLWKRFGAARNSFDRRRRQHFAQLGAQRSEAKAVKQQLVAAGRGAVDLDRLGADGERAARAHGPVEGGRDAGPLPTRTRSGDGSARPRTSSTRRGRPRSPSATPGSARTSPPRRRWPPRQRRSCPSPTRPRRRPRCARSRSGGRRPARCPRADRDRVEGRLRKVEETVRRADETRWQRTNPEGRARAESTVAQLEQAIAKLEADRAKALARGDERAVAGADEAIAARQSWLEGARAALAEFTAD